MTDLSFLVQIQKLMFQKEFKTLLMQFIML